MLKSYARWIAASALAVAVGCGSTGISTHGSLPAHGVAGSSEARAGSAPALSQPAGVALGDPVPADLQPVALGNAQIRYADNSTRPESDFINSVAVAKRLRLGAPGVPLQLADIHLKSWGSSQAAAGTFQLHFVHPNRQVYEVTTTFSSLLQIRDNKWTSGTRVFVVDAATGDVLWSITTGNRIASFADVRKRSRLKSASL